MGAAAFRPVVASIDHDLGVVARAAPGTPSSVTFALSETSADTTTNAPGAVCDNLTNAQLIVRTYDSAGAAADKPFYLTLTGTTGA